MSASVDFSSLAPTRLPTRKERGLYFAWRKYLSDSKLTPEMVHERAAAYAAQHKPVPRD